VKRSILLALVAALALGVTGSASADPGARATAKKKAAKCKSAKKKAGKSLAESSKAKKKACKPKAKAKPKPKAGFTLADGVYSDAKSSIQLTVSGGGKTAKLALPFSCFIYSSENVPLTISGNTAKASENRDTLVAGEPAHVSWSLTVDSTLGYAVNYSWNLGNGICKGEKISTGKFAKGAAAALAPAQAAAKKKAGKKKKAAKCKAAKKKAKGKAKGKARKSLATNSAKAKGKAKGKKKAKRKCGKAKAKPKPKSGLERRLERKRNPYEQKLVDRYRERREQMEERIRNAPKPLTLQDVAPADGAYTSSAAPGLTVTISGNSSQARVVYTVPKTTFDNLCQSHTEGEPVDITGPIAISQSTKRGSLMLHASQPVDPNIGANKSQSVNGSIGQDGSFTLTISASFPYPPDKGATCSSFPPPQLTGTLVK
jgi:hypothetical protein